MSHARSSAVGWILALLVAAPLPADGAAGEWAAAAPGYAWGFPADHWAHRDYRIEWWYLTGQLTSRAHPPRSFGYQFTIFRIGLQRSPPELDSDWASSALIMGHAAITDITAGEHRFSEVLYRESPWLGGFGVPPDPLLAWCRGPAGTAERWTLRWNGDGFDLSMTDRAGGSAFELSSRAAKPLVLQGPGGLSRKADTPGAASLYYSYTRLETTGRVELDGEAHDVAGRSWMDHEFSTSQLSDEQVGWDWFSLQLDDGREVMLFELRDRRGRVDHRRGTWIDERGAVEYLEPADWSLLARGVWGSPDSGIEYPAGWRVELPRHGLVLDLKPLVPDQENRSRLPGGPSYWEGAVSIDDPAGAPVGRGYVELTGYGENNRPPI